MWDMITMVPTIFSVVNSVDWTSLFAALATILGVLLAVSERLGMNPKIEANSVYQLVHGWLKKLAKR